jgi:TRAP-type mannitol/chloroaromatic compound transport system permease large subunit
MGMGVFFAWLAYRSVNPDLAAQQVLDLFVQRTYGVMSNDVLIAIPLFLFMGYLVERAQLIDRLFKSLHLATAGVPGSLAVATIVTCAIFATATGIVGAVVTLMGLLALPSMLKSGYDVRLSAGVITAGGCLGILIPPSVLLIVYGATAGVSVVQLYAGAFFPGIMLAGLYIIYVIVLAKLKPSLAPPRPRRRRACRSAALTPMNAACVHRPAGCAGRTQLRRSGEDRRRTARGHAASRAGHRGNRLDDLARGHEAGPDRRRHRPRAVRHGRRATRDGERRPGGRPRGATRRRRSRRAAGGKTANSRNRRPRKVRLPSPLSTRTTPPRAGGRA